MQYKLTTPPGSMTRHGEGHIPRRNLVSATLLLMGVLLLSPTSLAFLIHPLNIPGVPLGAAVVLATFLVAFFSWWRGQINTASMYLLIFVLVCLLLTGLWSSSNYYWQSKSIATLVIPFASFAVGFVAGKSARNLNLFLLFGVLFSGLVLIKAIAVGFDSAAAYSEDGEGAAAGYQALSRLFAIGAICSLYLGLQYNTVSKKIAYVVGMLVLIVAILFTGGRTGILMAAVFFLTYSVSVLNPYLRWATALLTAILLLLYSYSDFDLTTIIDNLAADQDWPASIKRVLYYLSSERVDQSLVAGSRTQLQSLAYATWQSNPLLGVGWGGFPVHVGLGDVEGMYPHNMVLELMAETGIIGLLIVAIMIAWYVRISGRRLDLQQNRRFGLSFLAMGLAISLSISDFPYQRELFIALGILAALGYNYSGNVKRTRFRPHEQRPNWG